MQWRCFCGSIEFKIIKTILPDSKGNGERAVIVECQQCKRRLKFNKWGMRIVGVIHELPLPQTIKLPEVK